MDIRKKDRAGRSESAKGPANAHIEPVDSEKEAWHRNADRLAKFALANLLNRDDAYGRYLSLYLRSEKQKAKTAREKVSHEILQNHFCATDRGYLIGLHTTSPNNTCRWLVIDIDHHGESDQNAESRNERAALDFAQKLEKFGANPLVIKSNGRGGFHIWVFFEGPQDSSKVSNLGNEVVAHWEKLEIEKPEIYPKQPKLDEGKLGNWLRLPGLHHTYDFYSQVWDGETWLKGQDAIDRFCNLKPFSFKLNENNSSLVQVLHTTVKGIQKKSRNQVVYSVDYWLNRLQSHRCHKFLRPYRIQTLAELLSKLKSVSESDEGWSALCPAHNDRNPSFSLTVKENGYFLVKCFCNCTFEQIVTAVKMTTSEMFDTAPSVRSAILPPRKRPRLEPQITESVPAFEERQAILSSSATDSRVNNLASILEVSPNSLRALGIGWCVKDSCWTFPEYNGQQQICGILRRFQTGEKIAMKGSHRGLTLPQGWQEGDEKLYICEGQSDVAAAVSHNIRAIGRPGLKSGFRDLAVLLKDELGEIIMVADNSKKESGRTEATQKDEPSEINMVADNDEEESGRIGATQLAKQLSDALKKPIRVVAPPKQFKDLRDYLTENPQ